MAMPFVVGSVLGFGVVPLPPGNPDWALVAVAGVLLAVLIGIAAAVPWSALPTWTHAAVPLAYFVVVALLRHAQGVVSAGYAPLVMLPIVWLALVGTRRQLLAGVAALAAVLLVPTIAIGGELYPATEIRRGILAVAMVGVIAFWIQALVKSAHDRGAQAESRAAALQAAEARNAAGIEAAPIGIATGSLDGTFLTVNESLERIFGRSRAELVGHAASEFSHPDDRAATIEAIARLRDGNGGTHVEEKRYLRPDGAVVHVVLSVGVIRDEQGRPVHFLSYFDDVTARREMERALAESEANLRAIGRVAQHLALAQDVREAICEAAVAVTSSDVAVFVEPDGRGELLATASVGEDARSWSMPLYGSEPSAVVTTFLNARRLVVLDAASDRRVSRRLVDAFGLKAVLFEPIVHQGTTTGVLVVGWKEPIAEVEPRLGEMIELLAAEAALALERDELLERLRAQALQDGLTGIPNRRAWDDALPLALAGAQRNGSPVSVAMFDLDHFKRFNDEHGHLAGDEFLRDVARAWHEQLRPGDFLSRYGGEEFSLVLAGCGLEQAERVLERLAEMMPREQTVSIGLAAWDGQELPEQLVARADAALYRAKSAGRARIVADRPRLVSVDAA